MTIWNSEGSLPTSADLGSNEVRGTITTPSGAVARADFSLTINYGTVGGGFGGSGGGYDVAALRSVGFVITNKNYDFETGLDTEDTTYFTMMRFFDAAGRKAGAPVVVSACDDLPGDTRVTQLATGEIVVIRDQDDDTAGFIGDKIYGRMFSATGQPLTARFDVGATVPSYFDQADPELMALPGGGFVVTFTSEYIDSDHDGVAARIFGRGTGGDDRQSVDVTGTLFGLAGNDMLFGDRRANLLDGGGGNDRLIGGAGDDTLSGGRGADMLGGGAGNDIVLGGAERDVLYGGFAADLLGGGAGADRVIGGPGADRVYGGSGADVFVYYAVADSARGAGDRVFDFDRDDVIDLRGIDANTTRAGHQAFDFMGGAGYRAAGDLRFATDGTNGYLLGNVNGDGANDLLVTLVGVTRLPAGDLLL